MFLSQPLITLVGLQIFANFMSAPVHEGMSDWVIHAQIWKLDIADYTTVLLNFKLSSPLLLPLEA